MGTPNGPYLLTPTAIHVHPVQDRSMRSTWQLYRCQYYHESIFLYFEFSLFHCFCNIPQTTEFYSCCLYSTGITPTPLLSNHSTMARTKTLKPSIIKTRAQSRTEARTGTNVRTNDDTIAPAPAGRTIAIATTTDPVPVTDDFLLFAGHPKTGALKEPPVPRDRDSDDAKKPAAKPTKGRPKKVAPKTTRKPRKP